MTGYQGTYTGDGTTPPEPTWNGPADYTAPRNRWRDSSYENVTSIGGSGEVTVATGGRIRFNAWTDERSRSGDRAARWVNDAGHPQAWAIWYAQGVSGSLIADYLGYANYGAIPAGKIVSAGGWVWVPESMAGLTTYAQIRFFGSGSPSFQDFSSPLTPLAAGWNRVTVAHTVEHSNTTRNGYTGVQTFIRVFEAGSLPDGAVSYSDDVWLALGDTAVTDYRPHPADWYAHGMYWVAAASGTIDGQTFAPGDRIYASGDRSADYLLAESVTWVVRSAVLLDQPPLPHDGRPVGVDDWRFVVELALPSDTSHVVGVGTVGAVTVSAIEWRDITDRVRGVEWTRGSDEPHGRPRVGELLASIDARDELSPLDPSSAFYAPGTLIRVSTVHPTRSQEWAPAPPFTWLAHFTGLVDSWPLSTFGNLADAEVTVTAYETLRDVAEVDANALASVVGSGDTAAERVDRLLAAAAWRYGAARTNQVFGFITVKSTDMALNRLAELYLTADSTDNRIRSGRDGRPVLHSIEGSVGDDDASTFPLAALSSFHYDHELAHSRAFIGFDCDAHRETDVTVDNAVLESALFVPYDADSLDVANDAAYVVNDVRFAIVGGTQQVVEHADSIARYGRRSYVRNDLIATTDTYARLVAELTLNRQARTTLRAEALTVSTSDRGVDVFETMTAADIGVTAMVYPPGDVAALDRPRIFGVLAAMTHRVTPRHPGGSVTWQTVCRLDTWTVNGLPAANLPPA